MRLYDADFPHLGTPILTPRKPLRLPMTGTELQTFDFKGQGIRTMTIDGNPWFAAVDVRKALGGARYGQWLDPLGQDEKKVLKGGLTSFRGHGLAVISESGMYKLVMRSDKSQARAFQDWVTRVDNNRAFVWLCGSLYFFLGFDRLSSASKPLNTTQ